MYLSTHLLKLSKTSSVLTEGKTDFEEAVAADFDIFDSIVGTGWAFDIFVSMIGTGWASAFKVWYQSLNKCSFFAMSDKIDSKSVIFIEDSRQTFSQV